MPHTRMGSLLDLKHWGKWQSAGCTAPAMLLDYCLPTCVFVSAGEVVCCNARAALGGLYCMGVC